MMGVSGVSSAIALTTGSVSMLVLAERKMRLVATGMERRLNAAAAETRQRKRRAEIDFMAF